MRSERRGRAFDQNPKNVEARRCWRDGSACLRGSKKSRDGYDLTRAALVSVIAQTVVDRKLIPVQAAKIGRRDQFTLSKVILGRIDSVSLNKLMRWFLALGQRIELRIGHCGSDESATLTVAVDG